MRRKQQLRESLHHLKSVFMQHTSSYFLSQFLTSCKSFATAGSVFGGSNCGVSATGSVRRGDIIFGDRLAVGAFLGAGGVLFWIALGLGGVTVDFWEIFSLNCCLGDCCWAFGLGCGFGLHTEFMPLPYSETVTDQCSYSEMILRTLSIPRSCSLTYTLLVYFDLVRRAFSLLYYRGFSSKLRPDL